MNVLALIAGVLSLLAFFVHAIIGDKEYSALKPGMNAPEKYKETWVQGRGGWHWVSVDLLGIGILLLLIATNDLISAKAEILLLLSIYFLLCGLAWLGTVLASKNNNKQVLLLGQWVFCFILSGLTYFSSQSSV